MRKRRMKKRAARQSPVALLLLLVLAVPASVYALRAGGASLVKTGERAAMFAAALSMPEQGAELLRERFQEELYLPGEQSSTPSSSAPAPSEAPSSSVTETTAADTEEADMPPEESSGAAVKPPTIPRQYRAEIISEDFANVESSVLVQYGAGLIKNDSKHTNEEVDEILETPLSLTFTDTDEPQVLIVHTHATEAFERYDSAYYDTRNTWRSQDNNLNMVSVGSAMAEVLESNGIGVIHDTTQHDYPSYNGSYERSAATIKAYLEEYPTIKVVLDLHRDAMERDNGAIVKPVTTIDGQKAAQIMIIAASDPDGSLGVPEYRSNLRFAAAFQSYMTESYPGLTRPVFFSARKYNMNLTTGSLLLEFGSNANTLDEALYAAQLAGEALSQLIWDNIE